jgi:hypothetical protein
MGCTVAFIELPHSAAEAVEIQRSQRCDWGSMHSAAEPSMHIQAGLEQHENPRTCAAEMVLPFWVKPSAPALRPGNLNGFVVRAADGTIVTFDVPAASGTGPINISPSGAAMGSYSDANGVNHGFVRMP